MAECHIICGEGASLSSLVRLAEVSLELIERGDRSQAPYTVVFVHGFWQAAWSWDVWVMPALAGRGYHCLAFSFGGHGASPGRRRRSIGAYVNDLAEVTATLDRPPVLVGHSMGGYVVQHYLARGHRPRAVVLVSPVPRRGAWGATAKVARRHPFLFARINLTLDVGPLVATPERAREYLVAPGAPQEDLTPHLSGLEGASYRAYLDMLFTRPSLERLPLPALVVGGSEDRFFDRREWQDTADVIGADLEILDGVGHQPMWEGRGEKLIDSLLRFLP